ncbi:signal peptidase I [Verruconis gallopava]|uniref:Mitochondrial inner membrane protease subunit n=1 Tax=Verruconis gallopava TaxID=253628 RepID=A0A0D2A795_9PEZI|nr:signal peptidase I [Verruconis gallopava]KIW02608.1 signal peptidase I [Verruconis gallopava]
MSFHTALRWFLVPTTTLLTIDFLGKSFARVQWVSGCSMAPTISPDFLETGERDLVLVFRHSLAGSAIANLRRGDIVTMIKPHEPQSELVKRVVALPGDLVMRDVRRVGKQEVEGGKHSEELGLRPLPPIVRVPTGAVWMEGDEWRKSRDSNDFGPISQSLITGRVWGVLWPPHRFGPFPASAPDSRTQVVEGLPPSISTLDFV